MGKYTFFLKAQTGKKKTKTKTVKFQRFHNKEKYFPKKFNSTCKNPGKGVFLAPARLEKASSSPGSRDGACSGCTLSIPPWSAPAALSGRGPIHPPCPCPSLHMPTALALRPSVSPCPTGCQGKPSVLPYTLPTTAPAIYLDLGISTWGRFCPPGTCGDT